MTAVLGFDTATSDLVVAATRDREVVHERTLAPRPGERPRHATELLAEIEAAAAALGGWDEVTLIAVGVGPGSFTGIRIGVATARALAQALGKPIAPVVSLAALAAGIGEVPGAGRRPRLAVIDARRGEAFAAAYGARGEQLTAPFVAGPEQLAARLGELGASPLAAGDGALRFRAELEAAGAEVLADSDHAHRIRARHLCFLAREPAPLQSIEPIYLRRPDAELWRERDAKRD